MRSIHHADAVDVSALNLHKTSYERRVNAENKESRQATHSISYIILYKIISIRNQAFSQNFPQSPLLF